MRLFAICGCCAFLRAVSLADGPYAPAAGQSGTTAIPANDPRIVAWGSSVADLQRGPQQIGDSELGNANWGDGADALRAADASVGFTAPVVSLGDGGWITLRFAQPITDGPGPDFAVFENGLTDTFLELAFVLISSDGIAFERFDSVSLTPTQTQVNGDDSGGTFGTVDPRNLHNLAGKYRAGFGTPFDLAELAGRNPNVDVRAVRFVQIRDVIGSIDPLYATSDSQGHRINDPWATPYVTSGFDLDAIAVLHQVPEPSFPALLAIGLLGFAARRRIR
ncbi:MAG TPA: PEP-CTERM sorting domain-containing protein [Chthoniobacteraceae bacterium]|jgi:hypothetical protein